MDDTQKNISKTGRSKSVNHEQVAPGLEKSMDSLERTNSPSKEDGKINTAASKFPLSYRWKSFFLGLVRFYQGVRRGFRVSATARAFIPDSLLKDPSIKPELYAGKVLRLSTCSGVSWFPDTNRFATVNFEGKALNLFEWMPGERRIKWLETVSSNAEMGLHKPEMVKISPDGQLLAISNMGSGLIQFYPVKHGVMTSTVPVLTLGSKKHSRAHGIAFSCNGRYFAYTTTDDPGHIFLFRLFLDADQNLSSELVQDMPNPNEPLKAKGIAFSPCGNRVVIAYAMKIGKSQGLKLGRLGVYPFDPLKGRIDPGPLAVADERAGLQSIEDITISKCGEYIFGSDQITNSIVVARIDPHLEQYYYRNKGGDPVRLRPVFVGADLSCPHGVAFSGDGEALCVTSYGDDSVALFSTAEIMEGVSGK